MSTGTTTECTLGALLRQTRLDRGLSLRKVASTAGITPMYLSLLERDACGPPSDEKLIALTDALGRAYEELFTKAGRVAPEVVKTILRHPTEWTELIERCKNLDGEQIKGLAAGGVFYTPKRVVEYMVSNAIENLNPRQMKELNLVLDHCAGTGGSLLEAARSVGEMSEMSPCMSESDSEKMKPSASAELISQRGAEAHLKAGIKKNVRPGNG